ncbi:MAG: hypothetical protein ABEN55_22075, partial [Bradymonadaceae bacterium]
ENRKEWPMHLFRLIWQLIQEEAAYLRGRELPDDLRVDVELGFAHASFDMLSDNRVADIFTTHKIADAKECGRRLRQYAERQHAESVRG